jgi:O-antigen/teichoic acid export membrane protein
VIEPLITPVASETDASTSALRKMFARSVRFNLQAEFVIHLIRVGGLIYLAHRLAPSDFGLLRILIVIVGLAGLFCTAGFSEAVIQRKMLSNTHEATAWWLTLGLSAVTALALFLLAPLVAWMMEMPQLRAMVQLIAIPVLIEGASGIPNARLQRDLRYGTLAAADIGAEVGFLVVACALIFSGHTSLSLAGGLAARSLIRGVIILAFGRVAVLRKPSLTAARELWQFAARSFGSQGLVLLSQNADYVMIGRLMGSGLLGYYSFAWDLLRFIPERLYRIVGRVTLPVFSRLQDSNDELSSHYSDLIAMLARLLIPAMAVIAVAASALIGTLYGSRWLPAVAPLRILTIGLTLVGLRLAIGSIYYAKNRPGIDFYLHGLRILLIVASIGLLARYGLLAVCVGMSSVESLIGLLGQWIVCALTGLDKWKLAASIVPGLVTAAGCALAATVAIAIGDALMLDNQLKLVGIVLFAGIVFVWREQVSLFSMLRTSGAVDVVTPAAGA